MKSSHSSKSKVALIEVAGSHDECLLSQLVALKNNGNHVILVCNKRIQERNPHFDKFVDEWMIVDFFSKAWKDFMIVRKMMKSLKRKGAKGVIFNTAQGGIVRNAVIFSLFSKTRFSGIIHTTRKFQGSTTQKIIFWKIKRYLILSDHLLKSINAPKNIQLDYFYPLRFPENEKQVNEPRSVVQITLIGGVENRRKDLKGFIEMVSETENAHFTFLGKSDPNSDEVVDFKKALEINRLTDRVTLFDSFVSHEVFDQTLKTTDAILPLIHPGTTSAEQYFKNQIAGAMIVSFSFKIPLLLHSGYSNIEEMKPAAVYYEIPEFQNSINDLLSRKESIVQNMRNHLNYDREYQEDQYISFVLENQPNGSKRNKSL